VAERRRRGGDGLDQVVLRDLLVRGVIGIHDWERKARQDVLINVTVFCDTRAAAASDSIVDAVDYRTLAKRIIEHVEKGSPKLVERLAEEIAGLCLESRVAERVRVRVEKPGAVRFAASVGVEIERARPRAPRNRILRRRRTRR
jgi:FolB domain-containing protein